MFQKGIFAIFFNFWLWFLYCSESVRKGSSWEVFFTSEIVTFFLCPDLSQTSLRQSEVLVRMSACDSIIMKNSRTNEAIYADPIRIPGCWSIYLTNLQRKYGELSYVNRFSGLFTDSVWLVLIKPSNLVENITAYKLCSTFECNCFSLGCVDNTKLKCWFGNYSRGRAVLFDRIFS